MKFPSSLAALALLQQASAHYVFSYFWANETLSDQWKYVRRVSPRNSTLTLGPHAYPHYDLDSPNIRCGRDATGSGPESDVATVIAGQKIGFRLDFWQVQTVMFHDGPRQAYLSRSPVQTRQGLQEYEADGDFFKVAAISAHNSTSWFEDYNHRYADFNFTLPATTPPGFYLLRVDSVYPSTYFNRTQFYQSCAQVEIIGQGNPKTEPGPMVRFPGAYNHFDEGIWLAENFTRSRLDLYKPPGPKLWEG